MSRRVFISPILSVLSVTLIITAVSTYLSWSTSVVLLRWLLLTLTILILFSITYVINRILRPLNKLGEYQFNALEEK